jgi:hypothetical protein
LGDHVKQVSVAAELPLQPFGDFVDQRPGFLTNDPLDKLAERLSVGILDVQHSPHRRQRLIMPVGLQQHDHLLAQQAGLDRALLVGWQPLRLPLFFSNQRLPGRQRFVGPSRKLGIRCEPADRGAFAQAGFLEDHTTSRRPLGLRWPLLIHHRQRSLLGEQHRPLESNQPAEGRQTFRVGFQRQLGDSLATIVVGLQVVVNQQLSHCFGIGIADPVHADRLHQRPGAMRHFQVAVSLGGSQRIECRRADFGQLGLRPFANRESRVAQLFDQPLDACREVG